jgi:hypothetical protein
VSTTSEEGPLTGVALEALLCSKTDEQQRRDETSDEDPGGGGDPDGTSAEGERSRLMTFLSSIGG